MHPGSTIRNIGILGGGQLARMLALAAHPLGIGCTVYCPEASPCATSPSGPVGRHVQAPYSDHAALRDFAVGVDAVTYEFENVPAEAARVLEDVVALRPGAAALAAAQDRLVEKRLFGQLGIAVAPFEPVDDEVGLVSAVEVIGLPAVLKTRREGYDGKGQAVLRTPDDISAAWRAVGPTVGKMACILEGFVHFEREVSVLAARSANGQTRFYPLSQNEHRDGVLRVATARVDDPATAQATRFAARLLEHLDYVGVCTLELLVKPDGSLLANEFAPRVHNSGHWTIEGAQTSQFANHMRAVAGLPLGEVAPFGSGDGIAMVNFLGAVPPAGEVLAIPHVYLHDYAKEPRSGRKVGHATVCAPTASARDEAVERLLSLAARG